MGSALRHARDKRRLVIMDADGRCGNCRGEMTSGGCPRCDATRVYPIGQVLTVPTRYITPNVTIRLPLLPETGDDR